ncbi:hypothetical protein N7505_008320 [Penicillium chrysogenum]|uniref:Uncharacterized protein n=1 Tax=Penicillium chrysogenum TaxID=5076 RepID=A0ABQ8WFL7_PENCH|nr:hypothetical protein N7505_008320 [Penicillium chrysogenum]
MSSPRSASEIRQTSVQSSGMDFPPGQSHPENLTERAGGHYVNVSRTICWNNARLVPGSILSLLYTWPRGRGSQTVAMST